MSAKTNSDTGTKRMNSGHAQVDVSNQHSNGFHRERVADIQRARMLSAMAEACVDNGVGNVTVAHVVERARVSRRTFYEIFRDVQDCFLSTFDDVVARAFGRACPAYGGDRRWHERIRAALIALLEFLDEDPTAARVLLVEAAGAGPAVLGRRQEVISHLVSAVEEGRLASKSSDAMPPLTGEGVVGAIFTILHGRMLEGAPCALLDLVNPLMSIIVLPYLGSAASRRELERPAPKAEPNASRRPSDNPLKGLDMRLTYRTACVLSAVAENPGSSNKRVASASGIGDQGQISKLLARLKKLGLVENRGPGSVRGEPNIWTLTETGKHVYASIVNAS